MQFKNILGHQSIKSYLIDSVKRNRISHAQLFLGIEGNGSLALAIAYAQYINCLNKQESDSCGLCSSCLKTTKLIHPDLHFSFPFIAKKKEDVSTLYMEEWRKAVLDYPYLNLDTWMRYLSADNKQMNINIAETHNIIKKLSLKSFEGEYKILILWLPEFLDREGNALLKLIEEPPAKTIFILVSQNTEKILPTILSRTQLVKIPNYSSLEIQEYLQQNKINCSEARAKELSLMAEGNLQRAILALEENVDGFFNLFIDWFRAIVTDRGIQIIKKIEEEFPKLGRENQKSFLIYAIHMFRQVVFTKHGLVQLVHLDTQEMEFAQRLADLYSLDQLETAINLFEESHYNIERNANSKILFLDLSLQLVLIFKFQMFPRGTLYI